MKTIIIFAFLLVSLVILTSGVTVGSTKPGCCTGTTGNVDGNGIVDLTDLSALVSYLTGGGYVLPCPSSANVNGQGITDLGDLSTLLSYLTGGGYVLPGCPITVTDIDSNVYQTVTIGAQVWMAENLKVTRYRNGDPIPDVTDSTTWLNLTTGAYCVYNNDSGNVASFGRLYNWYAASDSRNIAPSGWHVPTDNEFKQLEMALGMSQAEADSVNWFRGDGVGGKLKEAGLTHWIAPNTGASNISGFSALGGGCRREIYDFANLRIEGYFWTATEFSSIEAWHRRLNYLAWNVGRGYITKVEGGSIRCIKDN